MSVLNFQKLSPLALDPVRATPHSAGVDLKTPSDITIKPFERVAIRTDLQVILPDGHYGRIADRSSICFNSGLIVIGGVIDYDFDGNLTVLLLNIHSQPIYLTRGMRIAQLICERCSIPEVIILEYEDTTAKVDNSTQTHGGFGSTGLF